MVLKLLLQNSARNELSPHRSAQSLNIFKKTILCFVPNQVSWIRQSDSHILTVDDETFVSNPRISAIHSREEEGDESDTWTLQIKCAKHPFPL